MRGFWGRKLPGEGWCGQGKKGTKDAQKKVGCGGDICRSFKGQHD